MPHSRLALKGMTFMIANAIRHSAGANLADAVAGDDVSIGWHLSVLADPTLPPVALRFAGLIMHRFQPRSGYADITFGDTVRGLRMSRQKLNRARNALLKRGWIIVMGTEQPSSSSGLGLGPVIRFGLGTGPNGLPTDNTGQH